VPPRETVDAVAFLASVATLVVLPVTLVALIVAAVQLFYGRRTASGGALIALNESFRQAWLQFSIARDDAAKQHMLAEVMNLLNMACAILEDKLFVGRAGRLLETYLCDVFGLIGQSDDAKTRIEAMMMTPRTFEHILKFIRGHRKQIKGFKLPPAPDSDDSIGRSEMSDNVVCGQCGAPIVGEQPGIDASQRLPCPNCGSTARTYGVSKVMTTSSSVTVDAQMITYPQRLLTLARRLIDEGEFAIATIVAHMACEIATERSLSDAFAAKGIPDLEDPVSEFFTGHSMNSDRIRKLYTALTGDRIEQAAFWADFRKSAKRRNEIAHSGAATVTKEEAEQSWKVASDLVAHLGK
jgi:hypothetical protein